MNVPKPNIVWKGAHPNNFTVGRPGASRDGRNSFHHVVGSADSAVAVFSNGSRGASSHLVITNRSDIAAYQCVDFSNTAWTDGNFESNVRSITMEHHGDWRFGYNDNQVIENSAKIVAWLRQNYGVNRAIRHRDVATNGTICPADLPVERIWNRSSEIIAEYANKDNAPQWLKDRKPASGTVYAQKAGIFLRNLADPSKASDSRRFVLNQSFEIGSKTVVGGKTYFITKSSTDTNAPAGLLEGEVASSPFVAQTPWIPMTQPRKMTAKEDLYVINLDTMKNQGDVIKKGTDIEFVTKRTVGSDTYLRSKSSTDGNRNWGIRFDKLDELKAVEQPKPEVPVKPTTPAWADSLLEDYDNTTLYVLRATPLIDLENGHPYLDKNGKEVWYQAGDILEDMSAKTIVNEVTYELTEFSFQQIEKGNLGVANGIKASDLTVDPKATPIGTPANPGPAPEPEDPIEEMPDVPTPEEPKPDTSDKAAFIAFLKLLDKMIVDFIAKLEK